MKQHVVEHHHCDVALGPSTFSHRGARLLDRLAQLARRNRLHVLPMLVSGGAELGPLLERGRAHVHRWDLGRTRKPGPHALKVGGACSGVGGVRA